MKLIPRALSQPIEAFPKLHHLQTFFIVVPLEAWWFSITSYHKDESFWQRLSTKH